MIACTVFIKRLARSVANSDIGLHHLVLDCQARPLICANAVVPPLAHAETIYLEYKLLGLSPGEHVMALYRSLLDERGILGSQAFMAQTDGALVRAAG